MSETQKDTKLEGYDEDIFEKDEEHEQQSNEQSQRGEQYQQQEQHQHNQISNQKAVSMQKTSSPKHHQQQHQYPVPRPGQRPQTQQINSRLPRTMPHQNRILKDSSPVKSVDNLGDQVHFQQQRLHTSGGKPGAKNYLSNSGYDGFRGVTNSSYNNVSVNPSNQIQTIYQQRKLSEKPPLLYYSNDKDRGRRSFIAQMINIQNQTPVDAQPSVIKGSTFTTQKRKKIKDFLYGSMVKSTTQGFQQTEKEDLQLERRNLKIQMNVIRDENLRLKTKLQVMQVELTKKEKDIESMSHKLQLQLNSTSNVATGKDQNVYESFLVSQLKKQNREMKMEIFEKDKVIDQFKKDIKLTKMTEMEAELNFYLEESSRLRNMLEATMIENQQRAHVQMNMNMQEQHSVVEHTRIEEAFYEKEVELQREREGRTNLQMQLLAEKDQIQKIQDKMITNDHKMKKFNDALNDNKRKHKLITDKTAENLKLKEEVEELRKKAQERDHVYNKNKDLVTKQFSQQSAIDSKEKRIQELSAKNEELLEQVRNLQKQSQITKQNQSLRESSPDKPKIVQVSQNLSQTLIYNQHMQIIIFRAMKGQPISNVNDPINFKNHYNQNKTEIDKEIDYVKKLNKKDEIWSKITNKLPLIESHMSPLNYASLERFIDEKLEIKDKDQKKYLIAHLIFKFNDNTNGMNFNKLAAEIKSSQAAKLAPAPQHKSSTPDINNQNHLHVEDNKEEGEPGMATVRVNESIGEITAQFIPPSNFSQTPINPDEQSTAKKQNPRETEQQNNQQDDYEGDEFERLTEHDKSDHIDAKDQQHDGSQQNEGSVHHSQNLDSQQITEDQMLDIAEHVFQLIAERLKLMKISVNKAFGKKCQILDEFEGESNVEIVQAKDFLDCLRKIGVNELSELEIACLMRVLSKPEIDHSIVLSELQMVMENFGLVADQGETKPTKEEVAIKKQKQNKKKLLKELVNISESEVYEHFSEILRASNYNIEAIKDVIQNGSYEQLVKSKKKELKVILIKKEDFIKGIKTNFGIQISDDVLSQVVPLLQIDQKYSDVFQSKQVLLLFEEVFQRCDQEETEKKAIEEFYKPNDNIYDDDDEDDLDDEDQGYNENGDGGASANNKAGEVMNFEQLVNDEEEDYYIGDDTEREECQLNPISEDAQEESVSPHPKDKQ